MFPKNIFFLLLLVASSLQECGQGCLKCGDQSACLICNYSQGFVNINGTCQRQVDTRCINNGVDGKCLHCNVGYKLDTNTSKCIAVGQTIENCSYYSDKGVCQYCKTDYYPLEGQCLKVVTKISNCLFYMDSKRCAHCEPWYTVSSNFKACTKDAEINGCASQSNFVCKTCKPGYHMNPNNYVYAIFNQNTSSSIYSFLVSMQQQQITNDLPDPCQKIEHNNCNTVASAFECIDCDNEYYLTANKICRPFPFVKINNCTQYSKSDHCVVCENGYYLFNANKECKQHTNKNVNCQTFSQLQDNICILCNDDHYLSGDFCQPRIDSLSIAQCQSYSINADSCSLCVEGQKVTGDGKKCLPLISNCISYNAGSNVDSVSHTCNQCSNQTYLDSQTNSCISGTITNCNIYQDASTCTHCINKFYLKDGLCAPQPNLDKCLTYSNTINKQCDTCDNEFFRFNLVNHCHLANVIEGCYRYIDNQTCEECKENYFINNQNTCSLIPSIENCLRKNANGCLKCKPTHFLWQNVCYSHFHYQQENCLIVKDISSLITGHVQKLECVQCKSGFIWKSLTGSNLCIESGKLPQAQLISGCIRYVKQGENFICEQCITGKYLSDDVNPSCLDTCATSQKVKLTFDNNVNKTNIINKQNMVCSSGNKNKIYTSDSSLADMLVIGKCDAGQFGVYSAMNSTYDLENSVFTHAHSFPVYSSCQSAATVTSYPDFSNSNYKCKHYMQKGGATGSYFCVSCQHGYTGKVMLEGVNSYIMCDQKIIGCATEQWGGLILNKRSLLAHGINTSVFYSCHKCASGYIPFLFAPLTTRQVQYQNFQPFNMDNQNPQSAGGVDLQLQCLIPAASSFQMSINQFTLSFPKNCGLGLFDTSQNKDFTQSPSSLYCAECAPSYKKVIDANNVVTQCKQIPNCDSLRTDRWFNNCSKCENTHTWGWSAARGIHFDECIQKSISNCLVSQNELNTQTCIYCEKGFDLINGKCEKYSVAKCTSYLQNRLSIQRNVVNTLKYDNFWLIATLYQHQGCETCMADQSYNYVSVNGFLGDQEACVASYIKSNQKELNFTGIIPYCVYQDGQASICLQCNEGYILRQGGLECVINTGYSNCNKIDGNNECISCTSGFYLIKKKCVRGTIANCIQYDTNEENQKCTMCAQNYRPGQNNKTCILGYLNYCKFYENQVETSCLECLAQGLTFRYKLGNQNRYMCYLPLEDLNCENIQTPNNNNYTTDYQCSKCKPGYYKTQDQTLFNRTKCISHQGYDVNCVKYSTSNPSLFSNDFKCLECKEGYYVRSFGYHCLQRTVTIQNCVTMDPLSEKCQTCDSGFYLNEDRSDCVQQPSGVSNCRNYTDDNTCQACKTNYFLSENQCVAVPTAELISNCQFYTNGKKCERCNTNYVLVNEACVSSLAKNCLTFSSQNICATCLPQYYLERNEDGTVVSCVYKSILNCQQLDVQTGLCSLCGQQYFVDENGECQLAQFIPKCAVYLSLNTCKQCEESFYVSENKQVCEIQGAGVVHDMTNCQNLVYQKEKKCMVCAPGFYFVNENCETCNAGAGCAVCDYRQPTVCLICEDGYHQTTFKGPCTKTQIIDFFRPVDNGQDSNSNISMLQIIGFLMMLTLFQY